jgi:antitoxin FitA
MVSLSEIQLYTKSDLRDPFWIRYGFPMPTITLKNVPKSLHAKLVKRAKVHKRSLNQEAIACLEETLETTKPVPGRVWETRFHRVRELIETPPLTDDFLDWAISEGRA